MLASHSDESPIIHLPSKPIKLKESNDSLNLHLPSKVHSPSTPLSRVVTSTDDSIIFTDPSSLQSQNTSNTTQNINNIQTEQGHVETEIQEREENELLPPIEPQNYDEDNDFYDADDKLLPNNNINNNNSNNNTNDDQDFKDFQNNLNSFTSNGNDESSYIQDTNTEKVLLNNYTRNRRSRRGTNNTDLLEVNPVNNSRPLNNRNSTMTTSSLDTANIEINRMRSSVLRKREVKKLKTQTQAIDDEKVLVGNKVSEGHVNYVVAYNMLTGIRVAVSRCSGIMKPLTDDDFKRSKKLVFDVSGNELTPSSKYDFKFKDYAPEVFRDLRRLFGLDPADYLVSLTSKYILSELNSPGKSGSFFYFSRDYRFIIKTIHRGEHCQLRRILKHYHSHVKNNPSTLISQFYGLHRVKMPIYYGKKRKIYFIVMNNLFPPHRDIHETFDLKGSTLGRITIPKENQHSVLKDLNWIDQHKTIKFGPTLQQAFLDQLKKDVELLIKLNIMDYSFLIGFHELSKGNNEVEQKKLSVFSPVSSNLKDLKKTNPKLLNRLDDIPALEYNNRNIFYRNEGGIFSTTLDDLDGDQIYYFGIIDCLTNYTLIKRLETFFKSITNDRKIISAVPPSEYGSRFLNFIGNSLNENTIVNDANKKKK